MSQLKASSSRVKQSRAFAQLATAVRRVLDAAWPDRAHLRRRTYVENLEQRAMLAMTASVASNVLTIAVDDATSITVTVGGGNVKVNGADPGTGAASAGSITGLVVTAAGSFANAIDLSALTASAFGALAQASVNAGDGSDTLTGPDVAKTWNLTAANGGSVGGAKVGITYSNVEGLIGGDADDTFAFASGGGVSGSIAGGGGTDALSYSSYGSAATVDLAAGTSTGTGGVGGIENVTGGSGNDVLTGDANANVLGGGEGSDTLRGNAGNDALNPGGGRNVLFGGAGADAFNGGPAIGSTFGDALFAKLAEVRRLIVGELGNPGFTGFVYNKTQIPFLSFGEAGNKLSDVEKADVIGAFYESLRTALNGLSATADVQQVLFDTFGPAGLNLLKDANASGAKDVDDVAVIVDNTTAGDSKVSFNTPLFKDVLTSGGTPNFDADTELDFDMHLPGLPVTRGFGTHGGVLVAAGFDYDLTFGVSQVNGVFIDHSKSKELRIDLRAKLTAVDDDESHSIYHDSDAALGLLYATMEDDPSNPSAMSAKLFVDFTTQTAAPAVTMSAVVNYGLRMTTRTTDDGADSINPAFLTNFDIDWTIGSDLSPVALGGATLVGSQPTIQVGVQMDANSFFQKFVKPIVQEHVRPIFSSIDPLVEILTYKIPVLGVSIAEVLDNPVLSTALIGNFAAFFEGLDRFKDMTFPTVTGTINLGGFTVTQDARTKTHGPDGDDFVDVSAANITPDAVTPIQQLRNKSAAADAFFDNLDVTFTYGMGGTPGISMFEEVTYQLLQFPMFDAGSLTTFRMLMGHHGDLLKWDVPPLSIFYTFTVKQPIFPPANPAVEAGEQIQPATPALVAFFVLRPSFQAHFAGGFDTRGLGLDDPKEGFYLNGTDREETHPPSIGTVADAFTQGVRQSTFMRLDIHASALVGPSLPLGPLVIDLGLGIGLTGVVNWDVHDPDLDGDDTRVHASEMALTREVADTIFDVFGSLLFSFDFFIKIVLDLGIVKIPLLTRLQHLAAFKIFEAGDPIDTSAAAADPLATLDATTGALSLRTVQTIDPLKPKRANDNYMIRALATNADGSQKLLVVSRGRSQTYDNVRRVVADGGAGDDGFIFKAGVAVPVSVTGGDGSDHLEYQGTSAATLLGGAGNDNLLSGEGNDSLDGGSGNDHIESDGGNDYVVGGEGDDEIEGGRANDTLYGDKADGTGAGRDFIDGGVGNNGIFAGPGDDILVGTVRGANTTADGGGGTDELTAGFGSNPDDIRILREAVSGGTHLYRLLVTTTDSNFGSLRGENIEILSITAGDQGNADSIDDLLGRPGDVITIGNLAGTGVTTVNVSTGKNAEGDRERDTIYVQGTDGADNLGVAATILGTPGDPASAVNMASVTGLPYIVRLPGAEPAYDTLQVNGNAGDDTLSVAPPLPVNARQKVSVVGSPTGGTFTISFGNQTTAALAYNASAAQVDAALEALAGIGAGNVSVTLATVDGTRNYLVEFVGALASAKQAVLTTTSKKQKITIGGAPTGGTFTITSDDETTAALAYNATAAQVQAALAALPSVGSGNVVVTGDATVGYTVQFLRRNPAIITTGSLTGGLSPAAIVSDVSTLTGGTDALAKASEIAEGNNGRIDAKVRVILDGGAGTDTVGATIDADFVLADAALSISTHGTVTLANFEHASLTGGAGDNAFTVTDWTRTAALNGAGGTDRVIATNDVADFTLSDATLGRTGFGDVTIASMERADLTGGTSDNDFTVGDWTGTAANLDGVDGSDSYTINLRGSGNGVTNVGDTGSTGADSILVNGTAAADDLIVTGGRVSEGGEQVNYAGAETLVVDADEAADAVNVRGTSIPTTVGGGAGNDVINAGNASNTLDDLLASLAVNGEASDATSTTTLSVACDATTIGNTLAVGDTLNVNDFGYGSAADYALNALAVRRTGTAAITYGTVETINLNAGTAGDTVEVATTAASVNTTVNGNGGADAINVATTGASGNIFLNGNGGADVITVQTTGAASQLAVDGGAAADTITFRDSGVGSGASLFGGAEDDQVNVQATGVGSVTAVDGGAGDDTVNVGSLAPATGGVLDGIDGCVDVAGGGGTGDVLNVDDTGDATDNVGTLDATSLHGLGLSAAGLHYGGVETMNIGLGSGSDAVRLNDTGAVTRIDGNDGSDGFVVGPDLTEEGEVEGTLVNGTSHATTLNGGNGNDDFEVNYNTGELFLNGDADNDTFVINTIIVPGSAGNNVAGGAGSDTVFVYLVNAPVNIDGGTGDDKVIVNGSRLNDVFNITGTNVTVVGSRTIPFVNIELLEVNGRSGNDTFNVNTTLDAAGAPVTATPLRTGWLNGQGGSDRFNIKPTPFTELFVDGGDPVAPMATSELPGDSMYLTLAPNETRRLNATGTNAGGGTWSFPDPNRTDGDGIAPRLKTDDYRNLVYTRIEKMNHVGVKVTAPEYGQQSRIRVIDAETGYERVPSFLAFGTSFKAGTRVATGDVNSDGVLDIVVAAGPGEAPTVRVYNGATGQRFAGAMGEFAALDGGSKAGLYVAVADINRDGINEIVTAPDSGSAPQVRIWGITGLDAPANAWKLKGQFNAYDANSKGGVRLATGDFTGDGVPDIVTVPGVGGGGPSVRIYDVAGFYASPASTPTLFKSFNAFDAKYQGGTYIAVGDVNGAGKPEIIASQGVGGSGLVRVFNGDTLAAATPTLLAEFQPYGSKFKGEVRVAAVDATDDGRYEILTSAGFGGALPVRLWRFTAASTVSLVDEFFAYDPGYTGGVYVAGGN